MKRYRAAIGMCAIGLLGLFIVGCNNKIAKEEQLEIQSRNLTTITIAMKDNSPLDDITKRYFEKVEDVLNEKGLDVHLNLIDIPSDNYSETLNLMVMGESIPDIIYFEGEDQEIANQGILADLRPYIENSTYIKDLLYSHNRARLKNYPYLLWISPNTTTVPVMSKEAFESLEASKVLIEDPSIDNYKTLFEEIKLFGKASQASITTTSTLKELDNLFNFAFGNTSTWIDDGTGHYVYSKTTINEKNKLHFYRELYNENLLDKSFDKKTLKDKENAFYTNEVGIIFGRAGKTIDLYEKQIGEDLIVLPPAKGLAQGYMATDLTKESRGFAISSLSENKDLSFKVLDYLGCDEILALDHLGLKEEHYYIEDGKAVFAAPHKKWSPKFWEPEYLELNVETEQPIISPIEKESLDAVTMYLCYDKNILLPQELIPLWTRLEDLCNQAAIRFVKGDIPEEEYDRLMMSWYEDGGDVITEYANQYLNRK